MQDWAKDPEKDKEAQEREAEEKERKEEQDDPEEIHKTRAFDDWKDGGTSLSYQYLYRCKSVNQILQCL